MISSTDCRCEEAVTARTPEFLRRGDVRLFLFGGKGGVGKTVCALAAAIHLAKQRPADAMLVASTDPAHSLKTALGQTTLPANLDVFEIDFDASLERFKAEHLDDLREIARRGTFLDDEDIMQLLHLSLPGLDELMGFQEVAALADGRRYRTVVIDTAPMGHTLRFLGLFGFMRLWLDAIDAMLAKHRFLARLYGGAAYRDRIDVFLEGLEERFGTLASLLKDAEHCLFVPVALAENLSLMQTRRLLDGLAKLEIGVTDLVINRVFPRDSSCAVCRTVRDQQDQVIRRFAREFPSQRIWQVPLQGAEVSGAEKLAAFWQTAELPSTGAERGRPALLALPRVDHPAPMPGADARLILFAGKGGVGKTTLSCATALRLAQAYTDRNVLLFSTDPAHSLSACFEVAIGPRETRVARGLTAVEIDPEAEFQRVKDMYAGEIERFFDDVTNDGSLDVEYDRDVFERVMDLSPPGIDEIMALARMIDMMDQGRFDAFVLDTAPSGHLIRLLALPALVEEWLKVVFDILLKYRRVFHLPAITEFLVSLSKGVKALRELMSDPRRGQLLAVSIPTELSLAKTVELLDACRRASIRVPALFLNLATDNRDCPTCRELADAERRIRAGFATALPDLHQTVVFRGQPPLGAERLLELGAVLYHDSI